MKIDIQIWNILAGLSNIRFCFKHWREKKKQIVFILFSDTENIK